MSEIPTLFLQDNVLRAVTESKDGGRYWPTVVVVPSNGSNPYLEDGNYSPDFMALRETLSTDSFRAICQELTALRSRVEELEKDAIGSLCNSLELASMNYQSGSDMTITTASPLWGVLAKWCQLELDRLGAPNFIVQRLDVRPKTDGERQPFYITIRRATGATVEEKYVDLQRRLDAARAEIVEQCCALITSRCAACAGKGEFSDGQECPWCKKNHEQFCALLPAQEGGGE